MTQGSVSDEADRQLIRSGLDETVIVEAAAGTGKTTELVSRILHILESGRASVDQIVAVTFTEKAAGELKLRIRRELELARYRAIEAIVAARLTDAIQRLEEAHVSTIHGFCADLLRERPVEAGVDPVFDVLGEVGAARIYDEAFHGWVTTNLEAPPEGVRRALRRSVWSRREGKNEGPIDRLARAGRDLVEWRDFPAAWRREPFDRNAALEATLTRIHDLADLTARASSSHDPLYVGTAAVRELSHDVRTARQLELVEPDTWEARLIDLAQNRTLRDTKGSRQRSFAQGLDRQVVWTAFTEAMEALDSFQFAADCDLSALLREELREVIALYEELKRREGALDFVDLLIRARDMLVRRPAVLDAFQRRFTHLFVDEFQDTDPLQAEVLLLLAADGSEERDWRRTRPVPGKLFIVGDPKQAIYRFRRADVETYREVCDLLLARGAKRAYLHTSFRARPVIQRAINAAFAPVMAGDRVSLQADYVSLSPFRDESNQPGVVVLPIPEPYGRRRIAKSAIERSQPDAVGAFVQWLLADSGWSVTEHTAPDEALRPVPVEARHVCILFRRFLHFGRDVTRDYVEALEARGVPHLLVGGKSFHDREEVDTIRVALTAIEWPDDELSVFATLRGALFAIDDEALLEYRYHHGGFHPFRLPPSVSTRLQPIVDALTLLRRLHGRRNYMPVADTITTLLEETRAHVGFVFRPAGEQALANVLHVAELARRYEMSGGLSFRGFVESLPDQTGAGQAVAEAPILEEGSDGVRLMTVHKAKGLEFPVVILADMTARLRSDRADRLVDREANACYLKLANWRPIELVNQEARELTRDEAEGIRVAYVAATRARDLLVVPGIGDGPWDDGWTRPLNRAIYPEIERRREPSPPPLCPTFAKDSVYRRPEDEAVRPTTVTPGLHVVSTPDREPHSVVWWDPRALNLHAAPVLGIRQEDLIAKDVPQRVVEAGRASYEHWRQTREAAISTGATPELRVLTATEWAAAADTPAVPPTDRSQPGLFDDGTSTTVPPLRSEGDSVVVVDARGRRHDGGMQFGELVHAVLAVAPLGASREVIVSIAEAQGRILSATASELEAIVETVEHVLRHDLLARARAADGRGSCRRETPVTSVLGDGSLVEGVVDLAFEEADGWVVIDYKTDRELGAAEQRYRRQVAFYASAIARSTGRPAQGFLVRI